MIKTIIKFINQFNFKSKLIITYIIVVIISIIVVGGFFMSAMRDSVTNQIIEQCQSDLESVKTRFTQIISRINTVSDELYFNKDLESIAFTKYENAQQAFNDYAAFKEFNRVLQVSPEIQEIKVYLNNPMLIENGQFMQLTPEIKETEWYRKIEKEGGSILWQYGLEPKGKKPAIRLTRLLKDMDKRVVGILDIKLNENYLYSIIKNQRFLTTLLLNDKQSIMFSPKGQAYEQMVGNGNFSFAEPGTKFENMVLDGEIYINASKTFTIHPSLILFTVCMTIPHRVIEESTQDVSMKGLAISVVALVISFFLLYFFSVLFSRRINRLRYEMERIVNGDFEEHDRIDGNDEIAILYNDLCNVRKSIKLLIQGIYEEKKIKEELRKKQSEIQLQLLSNQINPHFLFNTLETIRMKAHCSNEKDIARVVKLLSRIMRRRLGMTEQPYCIREELIQMTDYLEIQKFRYGERINYKIEVDEKDLEYEILPFLIQPIVENAFMHGLEDKKEGGNIYIQIQKSKIALVISVSDNGVGIKPERLKQITDSFSDGNENIGIGLKNVNDRIKIYYGCQYGMQVRSELGRGTSVVITLPRKEEIDA